VSSYLLFDRPDLPHDLPSAYEENIVRHWNSITDMRNADGQILFPKYFQYLCLLFRDIRFSSTCLPPVNLRFFPFSCGAETGDKDAA